MCWRPHSGAVKELEEHEEHQLCDLGEPPVLQVIEIEEKADLGAPGSYVLTLSDGDHYLRARLTVDIPEDMEGFSTFREYSMIRAERRRDRLFRRNY